MGIESALQNASLATVRQTERVYYLGNRFAVPIEGAMRGAVEFLHWSFSNNDNYSSKIQESHPHFSTRGFPANIGTDLVLLYYALSGSITIGGFANRPYEHLTMKGGDLHRLVGIRNDGHVNKLKQRLIARKRDANFPNELKFNYFGLIKEVVRYPSLSEKYPEFIRIPQGYSTVDENDKAASKDVDVAKMVQDISMPPLGYDQLQASSLPYYKVQLRTLEKGVSLSRFKDEVQLQINQLRDAMDPDLLDNINLTVSANSTDRRNPTLTIAWSGQSETSKKYSLKLLNAYLQKIGAFET